MVSTVVKQDVASISDGLHVRNSRVMFINIEAEKYDRSSMDKVY